MDVLDNQIDNSNDKAVIRLTALWAFVEAGLGGMLHALKIPFTGLIVGGLAVLILTLIANFSSKNLNKIFKSLIVVLAVKAIVSPHSPFPAYFAVSFQAVLAYSIYRLFSVNWVSILMLSIVAMMESAIQKLIILTVFFGKNFWHAIDLFIGSVFKQFGMEVNDAGLGLIYLYLLIYFLGGILISFTIINIIKDLRKFNKIDLRIETIVEITTPIIKARKKNKLFYVFLILIFISFTLYIYSPNAHSGWISMLKSISYTLTILFIWYVILAPRLMVLLKNFLKRKSSNYNDEITAAIELMPEFRQIIRASWKNSLKVKIHQRIFVFFSTLIYLTLVTSNETLIKKSM